LRWTCGGDAMALFMVTQMLTLNVHPDNLWGRLAGGSPVASEADFDPL
jgi:hypothetical protein